MRRTKILSILSNDKGRYGGTADDSHTAIKKSLS